MARIPESRGNEDMLTIVDCCMSLMVEKKANHGEDCEKHSINRDTAFFGVFDGCGGAGSQTCPKFFGKTEAYIASRAAADAFQDWFELGDRANGWKAEELKTRVRAYLSECNELVGEKSALIGGIRKKFPTTAAAGICYAGEKSVEVDLYWAGDSRVYLLDSEGLAQLTEDDLGGIDAMENLVEDGVLTNLLSLSKDFTIHTGHVSMKHPGIIFAATDGCFGYLSTPMEFEYLLLETMLKSDCVSVESTGVNEKLVEKLSGHQASTGWLETLSVAIGKTAGDDYTLSGYAIGFGSYSKMKEAFRKRANEVYAKYISGLEGRSYEEKYVLWEAYKDRYHRLICRS